MTLFRTEAVNAKRVEWFGHVVLLRPLSFSLFAGFALGCAILIVLFLIYGQYTKRTQVAGLLVPDSGLIKVIAPQSGVIIDRRVKEGQVVKAGDVLFMLSSERITGGVSEIGGKARGANAAILETVRERQDSLIKEKNLQTRLTEQQRTQLSRRVADLQDEAAQIEREIATQTSRVASAQTQYQRSKQLADEKFLSEMALLQKQDELLDQQSRLQSQQRNRLALLREYANAQSELDQLPVRSKREQAQIARLSSELEQTGVASEVQRRILVTAPQGGTVTAILADLGQSVTDQPLLTLLPEDATLVAHLYVPSRAAGFIEPGQQVRIRYAAYPYQKFGQYAGTVKGVSRTALPVQEIPLVLAGKVAQQDGEGRYRIQVDLDSQAVTAYGKPQPLVAGMALDADILQDTRTLFEWVLEPLYSLKGKI